MRVRGDAAEQKGHSNTPIQALALPLLLLLSLKGGPTRGAERRRRSQRLQYPTPFALPKAKLSPLLLCFIQESPIICRYISCVEQREEDEDCPPGGSSASSLTIYFTHFIFHFIVYFCTLPEGSSAASAPSTSATTSSASTAASSWQGTPSTWGAGRGHTGAGGWAGKGRHAGFQHSCRSPGFGQLQKTNEFTLLG